VPVPDPVRNAILQIQNQLRQSLSGIGWTRPETIHLTLQFFGDSTEEELAEIGRIMLSIGRLFTPFEVSVQGVGAFPSAARPRVVWVGLEKHPELLDLYTRLQEELEKAGRVAEGRPFTPHLTLGRFRQRTGPVVRQLEPFRAASCGSLPVDRIVLFESRLRPGGALHLPRLSVPLDPAGRSIEEFPTPS